MAETEPKIRVTEEQVEFFCREGYLAIERITSDEEVERLRATYDELFARRAGREEGRQYDLAGTDDDAIILSHVAPLLSGSSRFHRHR